MAVLACGFLGGRERFRLEPACDGVASLCPGGFGFLLVVGDDGALRVELPSGGATRTPATRVLACCAAAGYDHAVAADPAGVTLLLDQPGEGGGDSGEGGCAAFPCPAPSASPVVALAAGDRHTLALTAAGEVFEWSHGAAAPAAAPPPRSVLPPGSARCVAAGARHSLAGLRPWGVAAWGWNLYGQCGTGDTLPAPAPAPVPGALAGLPIAAVAAGLRHSAALSEAGDLFTWGDDDAGQLGLGGSMRTVRLIPHLVPSPLLLPPPPGPAGGGGGGGGGAAALACGARHTAVLAAGGRRLLAWGAGRHGQLGGAGDGEGDGEGDCSGCDVAEPTEVPLPPGAVVEALACGWWHTAVLLQPRGGGTGGRQGGGNGGGGEVVGSADAPPVAPAGPGGGAARRPPPRGQVDYVT